MPRRSRADLARKLPPITDWRTTDAHEVLKRQVRAREERARIVNLDPGHPLFSDFEVRSRSGLNYHVEIRDVATRQFACTCTDFRIKRLDQVLATSAHDLAGNVPVTHAVAAPPVAASDPAVGFAVAARKKFGAEIVRCDETWLPGSDAPILVAVVRRAAPEHRPRLEALFNDTPWRGTRPPLHVIDASAWDALQALATAGLLTLHARATRSLLDDEARAAPPALTAEQQARVEARRALVRRKARGARALFAADLADDALAALREAAHAHAQADAITRRFPEPATLSESLLPPHDLAWPAELRPVLPSLDQGTISVARATTLLDRLLTP